LKGNKPIKELRVVGIILTVDVPHNLLFVVVFVVV
jgi:hypothetical protein